MHQLLLATTNKGKIRELRQILSGENVELLDLSGSKLTAPDETGRTFQSNACLKAAYYGSHLKSWTLADDSGLAVDVLGGKPGVHSARWAEMNGAGSGDAANNALLLKQLEQIPAEQRQARFVCCLALSDPAGKILLTVTRWVEGRILHAPRGQGGFGYDPLFLIDSLNRTTAELPSDEKNAISHRGKAMRRICQLAFSKVFVSGSPAGAQGGV